MKVFEALARAFTDEGVDTVFTLMGDANMFWLSSLVGSGVVRNVHVRHENAAVAMADGYARSTGKVGVVAVTSGPGLTQVATALTGAARYGVPLVVFAGDTPSSDLLSSQRIDHTKFADLCGVHQEVVTSAADCLHRTSAAFRRALAGREPVLLTVPMDVQELELESAYSYVPSNTFERYQRPAAPSAEAIDEAAGLIMSSRRPVVLLGEGAVRAGAVASAFRLGDRVGALFATTLLAKGVADGSAWSLGIAGTFAHPSAVDLLRNADLVIAVGASLNTFTTVGGSLFGRARIVQVLDRPHVVAAPDSRVACYLQGDAKDVMEILDELLETAGHRSPGMRDRLTADELVRGPSWPDLSAGREVTGGLDPRAVVTALDAHIPDNAIIVCDGGHFWSFMVRGLVAGSGRRFLFTLGFGSIGQGLPAAIGAAVGCPDRPVVVFTGDSGALVHAVELDTAVREHQGVLMVVLDDDAMGAEVHKLAERDFDPAPAFVPTPDLALMATAFGASGTLVRTLDELESSLAGRNWSRTELLDVKVSRDVVDVDAVKGVWTAQ